MSAFLGPSCSNRSASSSRLKRVAHSAAKQPHGAQCTLCVHRVAASLKGHEVNSSVDCGFQMLM